MLSQDLILSTEVPIAMIPVDHVDLRLPTIFSLEIIRERTMEAFYEQLQPFAVPFIAAQLGT